MGYSEVKVRRILESGSVPSHPFRGKIAWNRAEDERVETMPESFSF
jgi:hypothetical protein